MSTEKKAANRISYRILPRWLRNTDSESKSLEFGWVLFEILDNKMQSMTPLCYMESDCIMLAISPTTVRIADAAEVIDIVALQLPACIL